MTAIKSPCYIDVYFDKKNQYLDVITKIGDMKQLFFQNC